MFAVNIHEWLICKPHCPFFTHPPGKSHYDRINVVRTQLSRYSALLTSAAKMPSPLRVVKSDGQVFSDSSKTGSTCDGSGFVIGNFGAYLDLKDIFVGFRVLWTG